MENLEPGTSMGGARPKVTVEDGHRIYLAKLPEKQDKLNMQRIEYATLELARAAGLQVCGTRMESVGKAEALMLLRFDYDIVPVPLISLERRDLALEAGRYGRVASVYNLLSECVAFGLNREEAQQVIDKMLEVVNGWRAFFAQCKVEQRSVEYITGAILPECFYRKEPPSAP